MSKILNGELTDSTTNKQINKKGEYERSDL